ARRRGTSTTRSRRRRGPPARGNLAPARRVGDHLAMTSSLALPEHADSLSACAVCGLSDARALTTVRLPEGGWAVLCGTHDLMHCRAPREAESVAELREILRDRRGRPDRRAGMWDELSAELSAAFAIERRTGVERRRQSDPDGTR